MKRIAVGICMVITGFVLCGAPAVSRGEVADEERDALTWISKTNHGSYDGVSMSLDNTSLVLPDGGVTAILLGFVFLSFVGLINYKCRTMKK